MWQDIISTYSSAVVFVSNWAGISPTPKQINTADSITCFRCTTWCWSAACMRIILCKSVIRCGIIYGALYMQKINLISWYKVNDSSDAKWFIEHRFFSCYILREVSTYLSILACIGEADNLFQGGRLLNGPAPPSPSLFLQNRCKMKILVLQGGLAPPLSLRQLCPWKFVLKNIL